MLKKLLKRIDRYTIAAVLIAIAVFVAILGGSWIATCGIIKLITMCFGWDFSWAVATGIWLIMMLASTVFKSNVNVKK